MFIGDVKSTIYLNFYAISIWTRSSILLIYSIKCFFMFWWNQHIVILTSLHMYQSSREDVKVRYPTPSRFVIIFKFKACSVASNLPFAQGSLCFFWLFILSFITLCLYRASRPLFMFLNLTDYLFEVQFFKTIPDILDLKIHGIS